MFPDENTLTGNEIKGKYTNSGELSEFQQLQEGWLKSMSQRKSRHLLPQNIRCQGEDADVLSPLVVSWCA